VLATLVDSKYYTIGPMNKAETEKLDEVLLTCWNNRNAHGMASLFYEGNVIGFDGSQMNGPIQIKTELQKTF
jgi:hypothetical protein